MRSTRTTSLLLFLLGSTTCLIHDPSPAFPVPSWENNVADLASAFPAIEAGLQELVSQKKYDTSSFSIELTSNTKTLWSHSHTARYFNESRPGTRNVGPDSIYRIASISKVFTTLGLLYQHATGNLSLDDPVSKYITDLSGEIPWDDITLRILASQLSGIPSNFALGDLLNVYDDPIALGFPPASKDVLPPCNEFGVNAHPCTAEEMVHELKRLKPIFAPNQKSSYSNLGFELLGIVLANVTGMSFKEYMQTAIFDPLDLSSTTLDTPNDTNAVLPAGYIWWDVDQGVMNPTGGMYSSPADMGKFMRYILMHYNALVTGFNWLLPGSWADGIRTFYGAPFETFRTEKILLETDRPVTFVTKAGGMPGYYSRMNIMPEYGLGLTVLVGGELSLLREILEYTTVAITRAAEVATWKDVTKSHSGFYTSTKACLNSSVVLSASSGTGLMVESFISNGTDVLHGVIATRLAENSRSWRAQLVPTLLFKDEEKQKGEIWRVMIAYDRTDAIWDDLESTDIDASKYAGLPINEVVFWLEEEVIELPAWELKVKRERKERELEESPMLVVQ